jgi:hypothetical protein
MATREPPVLRVGAVLHSTGLNGRIRVLELHGLFATIETLDGEPMVDDGVPLHVMAQHIASGRWRLLHNPN